MADEPELDELARRYLELWEDHVQAMAADPGVSEQFGRFLQSMAQMAPWSDAAPAGQAPAAAQMQDWMAAMAAMTGTGPRRPDQTGGAGNDDGHTQKRPETAGATPGPGMAVLAELAHRLGAVEQRLAALEAGGGGTGKRAAAGDRKTTPKKPPGKKPAGKKPAAKKPASKGPGSGKPRPRKRGGS